MIQEKQFRQDRLPAFCGGVLTKAKALAFGRVLIQAEAMPLWEALIPAMALPLWDALIPAMALRVAGIVENVAGAGTVPSTWNGGWQ